MGRPVKHDHQMTVIAHSTRVPHDHVEEDCPSCFRPAVLMSCQVGGCIKVEAVMPRSRQRRVPDGLTREQWLALKNGIYWNEIAKESSMLTI